ncbi:hypothetical protein QBC43DRAFT_368805 [Cladorrhinum sp. PSN259]|nr:hypothetical protein QBC43DRAFT_368805 [Cladorrhinum sp. PSN259]
MNCNLARDISRVAAVHIEWHNEENYPNCFILTFSFEMLNKRLGLEPSAMDHFHSTRRAASHGALDKSYTADTSHLHRRPFLRHPLRSVSENVSLLVSPGPLESMLKTTTETGDLGLFSIRPVRSSISIPSPSRRRPSFGDPAYRRPPNSERMLHRSSSFKADRIWLPSYRNTNSEIISMYGSDSMRSAASSFMLPFDDRARRSYSMTTCSSRPLTNQKSTGTMQSHQGDGVLQRPRSPFPYPTRLKRPGRTVHGSYKPTYPQHNSRPLPRARFDNNKPSEYSSGCNMSPVSPAAWGNIYLPRLNSSASEDSLRTSGLTSIVNMYQHSTCGSLSRKASLMTKSPGAFYYDYSEAFDCPSEERPPMPDFPAHISARARSLSQQINEAAAGFQSSGRYDAVPTPVPSIVSEPYTPRSSIMEAEQSEDATDEGHLLQSQRMEARPQHSLFPSPLMFSGDEAADGRLPPTSTSQPSTAVSPGNDEGVWSIDDHRQELRRKHTMACIVSGSFELSPEKFAPSLPASYRRHDSSSSVQKGQNRRSRFYSVEPRLSDFSSLVEYLDKKKNPTSHPDFTNSSQERGGSNSTFPDSSGQFQDESQAWNLPLTGVLSLNEADGEVCPGSVNTPCFRGHKRNFAVPRIHTGNLLTTPERELGSVVDRSKTPMLAPQPISPARQLRLQNSVPQLMKALPPLPGGSSNSESCIDNNSVDECKYIGSKEPDGPGKWWSKSIPKSHRPWTIKFANLFRYAERNALFLASEMLGLHGRARESRVRWANSALAEPASHYSTKLAIDLSAVIDGESIKSVARYDQEKKRQLCDSPSLHAQKRIRLRDLDSRVSSLEDIISMPCRLDTEEQEDIVTRARDQISHEIDQALVACYDSAEYHDEMNNGLKVMEEIMTTDMPELRSEAVKIRREMVRIRKDIVQLRELQEDFGLDAAEREIDMAGTRKVLQKILEGIQKQGQMQIQEEIQKQGQVPQKMLDEIQKTGQEVQQKMLEEIQKQGLVQQKILEEMQKQRLVQQKMLEEMQKQGQVPQMVDPPAAAWGGAAYNGDGLRPYSVLLSLITMPAGLSERAMGFSSIDLSNITMLKPTMEHPEIPCNRQNRAGREVGDDKYMIGNAMADNRKLQTLEQQIPTSAEPTSPFVFCNQGPVAGEIALHDDNLDMQSQQHRNTQPEYGKLKLKVFRGALTRLDGDFGGPRRNTVSKPPNAWNDGLPGPEPWVRISLDGGTRDPVRMDSCMESRMEKGRNEMFGVMSVFASRPEPSTLVPPLLASHSGRSLRIDRRASHGTNGPTGATSPTSIADASSSLSIDSCVSNMSPRGLRKRLSNLRILLTERFQGGSFSAADLDLAEGKAEVAEGDDGDEERSEAGTSDMGHGDVDVPRHQGRGFRAHMSKWIKPGRQTIMGACGGSAKRG